MTRSILSAIAEQCNRTPNAPAITAGGTLWTYRTLRDQVAARAAAFAHRMRPGAVTAVVMLPEPESVAQVLAIARTNRTPLLLPAGLPGWEEQSIVSESGAAYLLARGMTLPLGEEGPPGETFPGGLMQLTSGSMGPSRPAFRSWDGVSAEIGSLVAVTHLSRRDVVLVTSSPAHSYAFMAGVLAPLSVGAHVVLAPPQGPDVARTDVTVILGLPTSYATWLRQYEPEALRAVRLAFSAGAPFPAGLHEDVLTRFGVAVRQDYGTTETGTIALDTGPIPEPGTVGTVLPHLECRVTEQADGEGEIAVRGSAVALGYVSHGRLVPCTDAEGWYHTLDLGRLAPDRRLTLTGRKRLPVTPGRNPVDPAALEAEVLALPGVREAAVLESPDGHSISVAVAGDVSDEVLERWYRQTTARFGISITVQRRPTLPRSPAGKLLRKYLLEP